jgi:hypothetical protein
MMQGAVDGPAEYVGEQDAPTFQPATKAWHQEPGMVLGEVPDVDGIPDNAVGCKIIEVVGEVECAHLFECGFWDEEGIVGVVILASS